MTQRCRYCNRFYAAYIHDDYGDTCAECLEWPDACDVGSCEHEEAVE